MSAENLMRIIEQQALLDARTLRKLRNQVSTADPPVSAEKIVRALVKKGKLSREQGRGLLRKLEHHSGATQPPTATAPTENWERVEELDDGRAVSDFVLEEEHAGLDGAMAAQERPAGRGRGASRRRRGSVWGAMRAIFPQGRRAPRVRRNRWDSPLLLLGGGGLVLLVLAGLLLWFVLLRGSGDDVFALAEADYQSQSYNQAIGKYEQFIRRFGSHPKVSLAECRIGLARMRQAVESGANWQRALEIAREELGRIKTQPAFADAMPELQAILPEIYEGFVAAAANAADTAAKESLLKQAEEALALVNDPEYLPTSQRRPLQPRIEKTLKDVALIERDILRDRELSAALEEIQQALQQADTQKAYAIRQLLLSRYPGLNSNAQLREKVLEIAARETERVAVAETSRTPLTQDHAPPAARPVLLADRQVNSATQLTGTIVPILAQGAVYGLDADQGAVLWRRWVGFGTQIHPLAIPTEPAAGVLAWDGSHQELLRLDASSGQLVWRLPLGEIAAPPAVVDARLYVSQREGELLLVSPVDGSVARQATFPQPFSSGPGIDSDSPWLYQPAEHSSIYVCHQETLECVRTHYLGHQAGAIQVSPEIVGGCLFVVENGGLDFSRLHVLHGQQSDRALTPVMEPLRLRGAVSQPLIVQGRRVFLLTDHGALYVLQVDPSEGSTTVRLVAQSVAATGEPRAHYLLVDESRVLVAADSLQQLEFQVARGELARKWADKDESVYLGPLRKLGNLLITQRRLRGSYATTVTARPWVRQGGTLQPGPPQWSVTLGIPPAMQARATGSDIAVLSSNGSVWRLGREALAQSRSDQALRPASPTWPPPFTAPLSSAGTAGAPVFLWPSGGQPGLLVLDAAAGGGLTPLPFEIPHPRVAAPVLALPTGQWVVCTSDGPIYLLQETGSPAVLPYQPELQPGEPVPWLEPAARDGAIFAGTAEGNLYRLEIQDAPQPHLAAVRSQLTRHPLVRHLAVGHGHVIAVSGSPANPDDRLLLISPEDLQVLREVPCRGRVSWGPAEVAGQWLWATDQGWLSCLQADGTVPWTAELSAPLAGPPLAIGAQLICAQHDGQLQRIHRETGERLPWNSSEPTFVLGEPLGAGPTLYAEKFLLLLGRDSTLHVLRLPEIVLSAALQ